MKPGDLVTIRRWKIVASGAGWRVRVYDRTPDSEYFPRKTRWEQNEIGVILSGRDDLDKMVQVLLKGRVVWAEEKMLEVINETR